MNEKLKHSAKSAGKWLLAALILGLVFSSMDYESFYHALEKLNVPRFLGAMFIFILINILIETVAIGTILGNFHPAFKFKDIFAIRCKTYILAMAHQNIGLGGIGYYLKQKYQLRVETSGSIVILMFFTDAIAMALIGLTFLPLLAAHPHFWGFVLVYCALLVGYGGILVSLGSGKLLRAIWYQRLSQEMKRVSFTAYLKFLATRMLFVLSIIAVSFFVLQLFGAQIQFPVLLAVMPACIIVGFLPITPFGVGTYPAALALFLGPYAASEALMAFGLCYLIAATLLRVPFGLLYWGK